MCSEFNILFIKLRNKTEETKEKSSIMEEFNEMLSDTSSSDKTVVIENEEINNILKKYESSESTESPLFSTRTGTKNNIYNLDEFSEDEVNNYEPLENRKKTCLLTNSSWEGKFSTEDFFEDSNDFDAVLNRISQLESEQFHNEPKHSVSKEIDTLISGAIIQRPKTKKHTLNAELITLRSESSGETSSNECDIKAELDNLKNDIKSRVKLLKNKSVKSDNSSEFQSSEDLTAEPRPKKIRKKSNVDKKIQNLEKEQAKAAKAKEREQLKLEKENQKQLKNALKIVENCVKPDQCVQYVTVNIDENLAKKHYGALIKAGLESAGYNNYTVSKQIASNLISWTRRIPTIENMLVQDVNQQEKHYMLIMDVPEFVRYVADNTLTKHIQYLLNMPQLEHLSIAILGLQRYYRYLRNEKNRDFKAAVVEDDNRKTTDIEFKNIPKVNKKEIERVLVELQIFCKHTYIRPVEKLEDLAVFVGECTKAVAQIPYKLAKAEALQQENEFFTVNNRDCVRVDKDGNGLKRLWSQFLRMFPLASLETAEAVTSVYPTMHSLMEAYKNIDKPEDGEKLLQDLPVRRTAGPLGGQRKLGPEFSKKAYKFFCSDENVLL